MTIMQEMTRQLRHVAGAMAALMLLASCGGPSTPELIARAEAAVEEGRYRAAIIDLRNAVANDPENAEARYRLGSAALALGDAATAEKELRRARELGYEVAPTIPAMAEALVMLGRSSEALAELSEVDEQTAQVQALAGFAYEASGDSDRALRAYTLALTQDPVEQRALLGKARFALAKGDSVIAEEAYEQAVAAHGDSPVVRLEYGRYLYARGRPTDAMAQYQTGLEQPLAEHRLPVRWDLSLSLAEAQLSVGQLDESEQTIDLLNELQPDHVLVKYLRSRVAFERKDLSQANELVARVLVEAPQFEAAQMLQATIHLARGEFTQARLLLQRLAERNPNDAQVRKLLAAARSGGEDLTTPDGQPTELSQEDVMALLGSANAETGDFGSAVVLWERVLREEPSNEDIRLKLITAYVLGQQLEQAQTLLDEAAWSTSENAKRAAVLDTLLSMRSNDLGTARTKAAAAAETFQDSAPIVSLQGLIEMRQDTALASTYFRRALEIDPSHTTSVINLASIASQSGDTERATALLRSFVDANPDDAIALDSLARAQLRAGDLEGARANLEQARAADPKAIAARLQLVEVLARGSDYAGAEEVARELLAIRPALPSAHNGLAVALMGQGRMDEGMASLRTALRIDPTAIEPLRNLAQAEYASNDWAQAQQTVDQLLRAAPNDSVGLELATRLAVAGGRADEAEALLQRLVETDPEGTAVLKLLLSGDIALARGDNDEAVRIYEEAFSQQPASTLVMRLFQARGRRGDEQPQQVLRDWLADNPKDGTVRLAAAQYAQSKGEVGLATSDYETLLESNPNNVIAWNNLAWAYSDTGDSRALEAATRALDLAKDSPTIQDTYGWMLILDGQLDNGISMLRDAWQAAPSLGDIGYHLAAGLARAGETEEARSVLAQALADGGQFATRSEAEQLMGEL